MENFKIYNAVREVPENALKEITGGRLKGKSNINPMWRIKTLTEQFGPCGIGWKYVITEQRLRTSPNGEVAAFLTIDLFYMWKGNWSEAIPGVGGSAFVINEKNGKYMNDECFKMALTDAISTACKALGIGADVYWNADESKYDKPQHTPPAVPQEPMFCEACGKVIQATNKLDVKQIVQGTKEAYGKQLCFECGKKMKEKNQQKGENHE